MIVYNVDRRFFAMKAEADVYRKELGMKPDALIKLSITNRDELAALLDGLCAIKATHEIMDRSAAPQDRIEIAPIPDCVPQFIRNDWRK